MQVRTLTVGQLQTNCYLLTDEPSQQTVIIDPGDEADFITTTIIENKLKPVAIVLTHGHYDHCLGVLELQLNFNIPIYLHQDDLFLYQRANSSAKHFSNISIPPLPPTNNFLIDKQRIVFGSSNLLTIHTPGHTPGSCCFISNNHLFTGDTLFATGAGEADRTYSSKLELKNSLHHLRSFISNLSANKQVYIYPGHEDWGITSSQFLS